ncbi:MAG: hypothetical protein AAGJ82_02460 [Bacteroidota bacterium]
MKQPFYLLILMALLFTACPDDEEPHNDQFLTDELDLEIVTGLNAYRIDGSPDGTYGNPNTFNDPVAVYPNPAISEVQIIYTADPALTITDVWMVAGTPFDEFGDVDYDQLLTDGLYTADEIAAQALELNIGMPNATQFNLSLNGIEAGYYRIFIRTSDERLYWENLYIDPDGDTPMSIWDAIASDWT